VAAIGKQTLRMRLLKVVCADFTARNLSSDGKYGSHTSVSIIQSVDQVEITRPATTRADGQLPGDLRLSSGCERAGLFMADLHPGNALVTAEGVNNAVQRISGHAVDSLYSHLNKCFDNHLGYGWHLFPPSPWLGLWISRTYLNPAVREKQPFISACFFRGNLGAPFASLG
jgi:hypothetical protein